MRQSSSEEAWSATEHMTDREWARVVRALDGRTGARAKKDGSSARSFVNGVIWMARTRAAWSDLPPEFGGWHSVYVRFLRWMRDYRWTPVIDAMNEGTAKRNLRRMVQGYLDRDMARDLRRKVLSGREVKKGTNALRERP